MCVCLRCFLVLSCLLIYWSVWSLLWMHTLEYFVFLSDSLTTHTHLCTIHTHTLQLTHTHRKKDASSPTNKSSSNAHPRLRSTRYPSSPPYAFLPAMSIECVWRTHHRTEIECLKGTFKLKEMFEHRRPALTKLTGGVPFNIDPLFSHKRVKHWTRN